MPRFGCEDNRAKSASARVLCGRLASSPRGEARAGRAAWKLDSLATAFGSCSRRPIAMSVKKSIGQRRGLDRAPSWARRQPHQVAYRAGAPWAVGRISMGRSARGSRAIGFGSFGYVPSQPQPPTWRGVVEEEPRPTTQGGARPALASKTTTPRNPPARAYSVGGRPNLHGARRARAHTTGFGSFGYYVPKPQPPTCRGVGEEEPRPMAWGGVCPDLAAKTTVPSPPAGAWSVCGRQGLNGAKPARAARHRF